MLSRQFRLRQARDITRVYKQGAYGGAGGVLSVKARYSGHTLPRAVVVVGKKVDKRAVVRNRNRRRLVEDLRARLETLKAGYDIVVTVHTDVSGLPADQLKDHLTQALTRAGAIK